MAVSITRTRPIYIILLLLIGSSELLCWGWNEHGMCATGGEANVTTPTKVTTPYTGHNPILVGAGAGHSLVLMRISHD